jgi:hypothetical protein
VSPFVRAKLHSSATGSSDAAQTQLGSARQEPDVQVGFGQNTISAGGAAYRTLDYSMKGARNIVPTPQQVDAQRVLRKEEQDLEQKAAAAQLGTGAAVELPAKETVRLASEPQAKNFAAAPQSATSEVRLGFSQEAGVSDTAASAPQSAATPARLDVTV